MKIYTALLCDADDTLFDFPAAQRLAFLETMTRAGYATRAEALLPLFHRINAGLWARLAQGTVTKGALKAERFTELAREAELSLDAEQASGWFIESLAEQPQLLPGALEAVSNWARKVPIVLVTNGIIQVQEGRLARSPIRPYIKAMLVSERVGRSKPHPKMLLDALALLDKAPEEALMLGDSLISDIAAAHAAGVDSCWFAPGGEPLPQDAPIPTHIARNYRDVALLLGQESDSPVR